jgi:hypothetical protein
MMQIGDQAHDRAPSLGSRIAAGEYKISVRDCTGNSLRRRTGMARRWSGTNIALLIAAPLLAAVGFAIVAGAVTDFLYGRNDESGMRILVPVAAAVAGALVGLLGAVWQIRREWQKADALAQLSQEMHFTFSEQVPADFLGRFDVLPLFKRGKARTASNLMAGKAGTTDVLVFDYVHDSGRQTVVLFPAGELVLPDFDLQPRDISDTLLGPEGLLFDADQVAGAGSGEVIEEFNRRYKLLAEPEAELPVRRLFPLARLAYFADNPGWQFQCRGGNLVVWQDGRERSAGERPDLLARATEMHRLLTSPAPAGPVVAGGTSTTVRRAVFRWLVALFALALMGSIVGSCAGWGVGLVVGAILGQRQQWMNAGQSWGMVAGVAAFVLLGGLVAFLTRSRAATQPGDAGEPREKPPPQE